MRPGNQLPVQPEWVAFAQPEGHSGTLSKRVSDIMGFFQVAYVGKTYDDPANLIEVSGADRAGDGRRCGSIREAGSGWRAFESMTLLDVAGAGSVGISTARAAVHRPS